MIVYDHVEDVIARANDSSFGLGGPGGHGWVDEIDTQGVDIPFGGHKNHQPKSDVSIAGNSSEMFEQ